MKAGLSAIPSSKGARSVSESVSESVSANTVGLQEESLPLDVCHLDLAYRQLHDVYGNKLLLQIKGRRGKKAR
jgi:hypothetical protein